MCVRRTRLVQCVRFVSAIRLRMSWRSPPGPFRRHIMSPLTCSLQPPFSLLALASIEVHRLEALRYHHRSVLFIFLTTCQ